ncbi:DnaJ subfamily C member 28, partial [Paragonimus westermani]
GILSHALSPTPQHRHYLQTESRSTTVHSMVTGLTPSERQRQIQTQRFVEAAYTSSDYRVARICGSMTQHEDRTELVPASKGGGAHRKPLPLKSINLIERIADDLIQEAMKRGEFDNLSGLGQPLTMSSSSHEAFQDSSTVRLTRILANQGYLPEWIQQGKESREHWKTALNKLQMAHAKLCASGQPRNQSAWDAAVKEFENEVMKINRSIDRYNLLVPALHLQRCHINASDAVERIMSSTTAEPTKSNSPAERTKENGKPDNENIKEDGGKSKRTKDKEDIWSMTYMAEIMRDFYRELVRAYVSMIRGFKNHK